MVVLGSRGLQDPGNGKVPLFQSDNGSCFDPKNPRFLETQQDSILFRECPPQFPPRSKEVGDLEIDTRKKDMMSPGLYRPKHHGPDRRHIGGVFHVFEFQEIFLEDLPHIKGDSSEGEVPVSEREVFTSWTLRQ